MLQSQFRISFLELASAKIYKARKFACYTNKTLENSRMTEPDNDISENRYY